MAIAFAMFLFARDNLIAQKVNFNLHCFRHGNKMVDSGFLDCHLT